MVAHTATFGVSDHPSASRIPSFVRRGLLLAAFLILLASPAFAHDIITTPVTWDREISRIFFSRCSACHREGGTATRFRFCNDLSLIALHDMTLEKED